jgi:hypothetical protein
MPKDHAGYQADDDTRYRKADALKEPNGNVIGGVGDDAVRIGSHLECPLVGRLEPRHSTETVKNLFQYRALPRVRGKGMASRALAKPVT